MDYQLCDDCGEVLDICELEHALRDGKYLCDICRICEHDGVFGSDCEVTIIEYEEDNGDLED